MFHSPPSDTPVPAAEVLIDLKGTLSAYHLCPLLTLMCTCMHAYIYTYMYTHAHTHTHTHTHMYMYIRVHAGHSHSYTPDYACMCKVYHRDPNPNLCTYTHTHVHVRAESARRRHIQETGDLRSSPRKRKSYVTGKSDSPKKTPNVSVETTLLCQVWIKNSGV